MPPGASHPAPGAATRGSGRPTRLVAQCLANAAAAGTDGRRGGHLRPTCCRRCPGVRVAVRPLRRMRGGIPDGRHLGRDAGRRHPHRAGAARVAAVLADLLAQQLGGKHADASTAIGLLGGMSLTATVALIPACAAPAPDASRGRRPRAPPMSGQVVSAAPAQYKPTKAESRISDRPVITKTLFLGKVLYTYSMRNLREG